MDEEISEKKLSKTFDDFYYSVGVFIVAWLESVISADRDNWKDMESELLEMYYVNKNISPTELLDLKGDLYSMAQDDNVDDGELGDRCELTALQFAEYIIGLADKKIINKIHFSY